MIKVDHTLSSTVCREFVRCENKPGRPWLRGWGWGWLVKYILTNIWLPECTLEALEAGRMKSSKAGDQPFCWEHLQVERLIMEDDNHYHYQIIIIRPCPDSLGILNRMIQHGTGSNLRLRPTSTWWVLRIIYTLPTVGLKTSDSWIRKNLERCPCKEE